MKTEELKSLIFEYVKKQHFPVARSKPEAIELISDFIFIELKQAGLESGEAPAEIEDGRVCDNCKYIFLHYSRNPCCDCSEDDYKWEPKNTIIMEEQIKQIVNKYFPHAEYNETIGMITDLEKLLRDTYLGECIEKAAPNLSKIEDVDKELSKIKGADNCDNCFFEHLNYWDNPCDICSDFDEWKSKTE